MTTEHLIVEEDIVHVFSDEIQHALQDGYTVVASNSFWDFQKNAVSYFALLIKHSSYNDGDIPFSITTPRPQPLG